MNTLPTVSTGETVIGLTVVALACVGAVTVGKKLWSGTKKLVGKFHKKKETAVADNNAEESAN